VPINVDFQGLKAKNSDVVGWIYSPNTVINYPVVQAEDNEYYLKRGIDGDYLISGTIFTDYRNKKPLEDTNYIIYGHNMKNNTIFASLSKYSEQSYYDEHSELYYLTPDECYLLEPVAGAVVEKKDMIFKTMPGEEFSGYVESLIDKSGFKSKATYASGDKLMTLSTCSYDFDDARFVLVCKVSLM